MLITLWVKSLMEESSRRQGVVQSCLKRVVYTVGNKSNGEEKFAVVWVEVCLRRVVDYIVGYMSDGGE